MECPHCKTELKYRERGDRRCSSCDRLFALEPKDNELRLHDVRFRRLVDKLSAGGRWYFTLEHLRLAASRGRTRSSLPTWMGPGVFIAAGTGVLAFQNGGRATGERVTAGLVIGFLAMIIVEVVFLLAWAARSWLGHYPQLPTSREEFADKIIRPWGEIYGRLPAQVIDPAHSGLRVDGPAPEVRAVLACPDPDVVACLRANRVPAELGIRVLPLWSEPQATDAEILHLLRGDPALPLLVLHDASVAGCLLPDTLPGLLGLSPRHRVVDLGLRPAQVSQYRLIEIGAGRPQRSATALLRSRGRLPNKEIRWLARGRSTPLTALRPAQLISLVRIAVERVIASGLPELTPSEWAWAANAGFLTPPLPSAPAERPT